MLPVSRESLRKRTTELMLPPHCSAASGMVAPPSIAPTTRLRRSSEYGFAIHAGLLPAGSLNHIRAPMGIHRFSLFGERSNGDRGHICGSNFERRAGVAHRSPLSPRLTRTLRIAMQ